MNQRFSIGLALSVVAACGGGEAASGPSSDEVVSADDSAGDGAVTDTGAPTDVAEGLDGAADTTTADPEVTTDDTTGAVDTAPPVDTALDVVPTGPCQPNPCAPSPVGTTCDGGRVAPFASAGLCVEAFDGIGTCTWPAAAEGGTDCAATGQLCVEGACQVPGTTADYAFQPLSTRVSTMKLSPPGTGLDADGDGTPDDAFGELLEGASAALGEGVGANALLQGGIDKGVLILLFDHAPGSSVMNAFQAVATNTPPPYESLTVHGDSFLAGTAVPRFRFDVAKSPSGDLDFRATGDGFEVQIPLKELGLRLPIRRVVLEGTFDATSPGVMATATLGGIVPVAAWAERLNQLVALECPCMGLAGAPIIAVPGPNALPVCNEAATAGAATCPGAGRQRDCRDLPFYCFAISALFAPGADLDIDGDGTFDAMSISLEITGSPVAITGVTP